MALNGNDFLTVTQCASVLEESRQTIYNRLKRGTAPKHERIGNRYFFYRADAERMKAMKSASGESA